MVIFALHFLCFAGESCLETTNIKRGENPYCNYDTEQLRQTLEATENCVLIRKVHGKDVQCPLINACSS